MKQKNTNKNTSSNFNNQNIDINYSSFHRRLIASTLDLIIAFFIIMPPFNFLSNEIITYLNIDFQSIARNFQLEAPSNVGTIGMIGEYMKYLDKNGLLLYSILFFYVIPITLLSIYLIFFWSKYSATPGKMIMRCKIVDEKTFKPITTKQIIKRFCGYLLDFITFGFAFFIINMNQKRKGLHDYLANTIVINTKKVKQEKK